MRWLLSINVSCHICELKHDLAADGFCMKGFYETEAAFCDILLLFNPLGEFQRAAGLPTTRNTPDSGVYLRRQPEGRRKVNGVKYTLRHTAITHLLQYGVDLPKEVIAKLPALPGRRRPVYLPAAPWVLQLPLFFKYGVDVPKIQRIKCNRSRGIGTEAGMLILYWLCRRVCKRCHWMQKY